MKRTSFSTLLTALVIMAGFSINSMEAVNQITHIVNYNDTPVIGTDTLGGVTYSTVTYGDLFNDGEAGKPSLPVDYLRFSVPYNATNFSVSTTWRINVSHNLNHLLYPCQAPRWMNDTTPIQVTLPDTAAYYLSNNYPSQMAWVVDEGLLAGENHIVTVAVMPFSYSHTTTSDRVYQKKKITVKLSYELSDSPALYPIFREDSALREEGYRMAQSMVVNPGQVSSFSYSYNHPDPIGPVGPIDPNGSLSGGDGLNGGYEPCDPGGNANYGGDLEEADRDFPYLIVTTNELYHSMRRLAALKRQKGYKVKIVTMNQVMNDSVFLKGDISKARNGTIEIAYNDSAGILRQYLKECYMFNKTKYVLLAGNVPYRYVYYWNGFTVSDSLPSDIYYSDLNGFFSSDIFKEQFDTHPELFVGRLIIKGAEQVDNYTEKLLRYELNPGNGDSGYLKRILYSEGIDMQKDRFMQDADRYYNIILPYKTTILEDSINEYPSGADVIDSLNTTHYGYISMMNHAGPSGFITYEKKGYEHPNDFYLWAIDSIHIIYNNVNYTNDSHTSNGLNCLANKYHPNICYSIGCSTMPFDRAPGYETVLTNCGESFTMGKDYGGPAFLGNTRAGRFGGANNLEVKFAELLASGMFQLGKAEAFSKMNYKTDKITCKLHNLLGDPEFEIWTDEPMNYSSINITRGDSTFAISGLGTVASTIAYSDNEGNIGKVVTSSEIIINKVSPNCSIMIYKHNYLPYIAPLLLQNVTIERSQYVIADEVLAGNSIDNIRTPGDVTISNGVEYEIEASGTVRLEDGFMVEKGAIFAVYPSCF